MKSPEVRKVDDLREIVSDDRLLKQVQDDNGQFKHLLSSIKAEINALNESTAATDDLKYNLQNLQVLNESFQNAQDKLNILVSSIEDMHPEAIKRELDLENSFNSLHPYGCHV